ncbi:MAG: DUF2264 domain-containing protein [Hamadaea sp.]|uniref:DUF2264 domain-containing protein n=1 Tax=Hamadaea sp. TaxID=2024425 RepID=UPI0018125BC9|nr:DUF2264 domain-containing protein [Hamadaea sp.]NUT21172.1 DUF2264 domain-containing protein [Hamadaea sp.]
MPSLHQIHGAVSAHREGWLSALLAVVSPATRTAALGPDRQPVHATNHDSGATWFELVARPLWGLAAAAAGGLRADAQWHELRGSLTAAVDPAHPWYIGPPPDLDQRIVESAAVGYALAVAPHELWDPLTGPQRDHLRDWLSAAANATPVDNNWHFFPVLAATGLRSVGVQVDEARVTAHLDRLEEFALTEGWYADGPGLPGRTAPRDYYVPFGFHFYGLLLASLGAVDPARAERFRSRAVEFAQQFQHWFADDGAALPFGRSLGYRFAQGSFWSVLAAADVPALPWDRVRGLAGRHLDWWWQQPAAAEDGGLTVGYAYPNTGVVEQYLAGGSPYWGTKFFSALAAAADHPFWTAEPAAPARASVSVQAAPTMVLAAPTMVLAKDAAGDVVALNGQHAPLWNARGGAAKYAKFAYSTLAGTSVPTGGADLENSAFDSALGLSDDGVHWRTRSTGESSLDGATIVIRWEPYADVTVESRLWFDEGVQIREHRIVTGRPLYVAEGGFCVPVSSAPSSSASSGALAGAGSAAASGGGIDSSISSDDPGRVGEIVHPMPGSHLYFPRTALPTLRSELAPGTHVLRCRVRVSRVSS